MSKTKSEEEITYDPADAIAVIGESFPDRGDKVRERSARDLIDAVCAAAVALGFMVEDTPARGTRIFLNRDGGVELAATPHAVRMKRLPGPTSEWEDVTPGPALEYSFPRRRWVVKDGKESAVSHVARLVAEQLRPAPARR